MTEAWLYDGRSAVRRGARVEAEAGGIRLVSSSGAAVSLPTALLTHVETRGNVEVFGHREIPGWRLGIPRPVPGDIEDRLPGRQVYGGIVDRLGLVRALLIGAVLSVAVVAAATQLPALLAPVIPMSWEQRFGDALVGDLGGKACAGAGGQAALDKLTRRLTPEAGQLKVRVVDLPMVNAVALPGGNIVIFRELLEEADSPDATAGVLAHEIAHVENRDVTRSLIRHYGFGVLLATVGGTTGANAETFLAASYSRAAEDEADAAAIASLARANISPVPTARFFEKLAKLEAKLGDLGDAFNYISSHPLTEDRQQLFLESAAEGRRYEPALTQDEWDALLNICFNDPRRRSGA